MRYSVWAKSILTDAYSEYMLTNDLDMALSECEAWFDEQGWYSMVTDNMLNRIIYIDYHWVSDDVADWYYDFVLDN
jgi:hypothetical protein